MDLSTLEFWVIVPFGATFFYFTWQHCTRGETATRNQKWLWWQGCLLSAAVVFGIGGSLSRYRIEHSDRPGATGTITRLSTTGGKSHSSYFDLLTDEERTLSLQTGDARDYLKNGDRVTLTYLADYGMVLNLHKLADPPDVWHNSSDEDGSAIFSQIAGAASAVAAFLLLLFKRKFCAVDSED